MSTSTGVVFQHSFGHQVWFCTGGNLEVEVPFAWLFPGKSTASGLKEPSRILTFFLTPGIRFKVPVASRVSLYGVLGGGYGAFRRFELDVNSPNQLRARPTLRGVYDFGGGIDVRLSRLWSLRAETRDFVGGKGLDGATGRHHVYVLGGIALHF